MSRTLLILDVTIIKKSNFLEFEWYHKPIFSGRYYNFLYLLFQKRRTLMDMIGRFSSRIQDSAKIIYSLLSMFYLIATIFSNSFFIQFLTPLTHE